ncbi:hypothetical protein [Epilithonimonas arachidiradicis]|uniref:Uncharacterized protein n=2 Tax=Epilithonimonas arachidiradicis TaxID=1617282 RepID=A0A420D9D8_9FLAO|nr:hypothetical protein [Epilithonimonas arachidiradicis]RKE87503.1 hypothetical protein BXY58_1618 [Epilithonimonas arachidiradicis]
MIGNFLKTWWKPIILYLVIYGIYLISLLCANKFIIEIFEWLLYFPIIIVIISSVYIVFKSKWYYSLLQFGVLGVTIIYLITFLMFYSNDFFADDLEIPKNIKFEKPKFEIDTLTIREHNTLEIKNDSQPGIYEYYFWYKPSKKGELYVKASEITQNIPLSKQQIKEKSLIKVKPNDNLQLFHKIFTIYEGDWGKPYGSKISVYFKPDNKPEQKLIEKNYMVEGWMR